MSDRRLRLSLSIGSIGYHYAAWRLPESPAHGGLSIRHYIDGARLAERGLFDFVFLADTAAMRNIDDPRIARHREHGQATLEPTLVLSAVAAVTSRIGLVPTVSTTYNHPYNFARRMASIDHISRGRAGWNMVTSFSIDEAHNFGLDQPIDSDNRHGRAAEFLDVINGLWDSWDDDAFLRDKKSGQYFDPTKFHRLNHRGLHFQVRGPLDTARPPQGRLPVVTAGTSENSQDLAARVADMVYGGQPNIDSARAYYASVKGRLAAYGRGPDELKMMPGIMPFVGRTRQEAQDKFDRLQELLHPDVGCGMLVINHFPDLRGYPIDEPLPDFSMRDEMLAPGHKVSGREPEFSLALMDRIRREKLSLRQVFEVISAGFWSLGVIGTATDIADVMEEWFFTNAADGFNIQPPYLPGAAEDFVALVIPELQRRNMFREEYEGRTLRENLGLPPVASRYAMR
jgi:alkanesulfonate monooxygenase